MLVGLPTDEDRMRGNADTWIGLIWLLSAHQQRFDRLLPARARQPADRMRTEREGMLILGLGVIWLLSVH